MVFYIWAILSNSQRQINCQHDGEKMKFHSGQNNWNLEDADWEFILFLANYAQNLMAQHMHSFM